MPMNFPARQRVVKKKNKSNHVHLCLCVRTRACLPMSVVIRDQLLVVSVHIHTCL